MFAIVALYLLFSLKWGPKWMEARKAYDLKNLIAIYNAIQVIANTGIFILVRNIVTLNGLSTFQRFVLIAGYEVHSDA